MTQSEFETIKTLIQEADCFDNGGMNEWTLEQIKGRLLDGANLIDVYAQFVCSIYFSTHEEQKFWDLAFNMLVDIPDHYDEEL